MTLREYKAQKSVSSNEKYIFLQCVYVIERNKPTCPYSAMARKKWRENAHEYEYIKNRK
jgi:hypothetical protein